MGSPMPWNTTPCTLAPGGKVRRTTRTCSTISQASRLRTRPIRPVAQKRQPRAQPTCELTQTEKRPARSRGMRTVSMRWPSRVRSATFWNGSRALASSRAISSVGVDAAARMAARTMRRTPPSGPSVGSSRCTAATIFRASATVMGGTAAARSSGVMA